MASAYNVHISYRQRACTLPQSCVIPPLIHSYLLCDAFRMHTYFSAFIVVVVVVGLSFSVSHIVLHCCACVCTRACVCVCVCVLCIWFAAIHSLLPTIKMYILWLWFSLCFSFMHLTDVFFYFACWFDHLNASGVLQCKMHLGISINVWFCYISCAINDVGVDIIPLMQLFVSIYNSISLFSFYSSIEEDCVAAYGVCSSFISRYDWNSRDRYICILYTLNGWRACVSEWRKYILETRKRKRDTLIVECVIWWYFYWLECVFVLKKNWKSSFWCIMHDCHLTSVAFS